MYLPRIFAKFCITLVVLLCRVVDSSCDAVSVPLTALSVRTELTSVGESRADNPVKLLWLLPDISDGAGRSKLIEIQSW